MKISNQTKYTEARNNGATHEEAAGALGVTNDAARMLKSRFNKANSIEGLIKADEREVAKQRKPRKVKPAPEVVTRAAGITATMPTVPTFQMPDTRRTLLIVLLIAPTVASVQNMAHVSREIMGDAVGALSLTVVLSLTALGFVLAGVKQWYTYALAFALIAFESFANLTRIYAGLMIGGKWGTSAFLGRVCDVFNSGSHYTAISIGAFTALVLAGTQYATIFELNKK